MRHADEARRMFADLKYVVIDELHAFIGADRGLQLQCELVRIDRMLGREVRRVGLSATISDYAAAEGDKAVRTCDPVFCKEVVYLVKCIGAFRFFTAFKNEFYHSEAGAFQ